jgi:uncharacterized membrane protein
MPHCPHCGQEMDTGSEFCRACGQSLTAPGEATEATEAPATASLPEQLPIGEVKVGDYFKAGWELFKKYPAGFIGYAALFIIIMIIANQVPVIHWLAGLILPTPLAAGFFVVSAKLLQNRTPEFTDFFGGFNFFLQLVLLGVVTSVFIGLGLILLIIPGIYLMVSYLFALMFVVDRGLDFWPAMETSRRSLQARWFSFFTLFLVIFFLNIGGLLLLGVGLLVSLPLSYCILTVAYADIFGFKSAPNISTTH